MQKYSFTEVTTDELFIHSLFTSKEFINLNKSLCEKMHLVGVVDEKQNLLISFGFFLKNKIWQSPIIGTFTGVGLASFESINALEFLAKNISQYLFHKTGYGSVEIQFPPQCYPSNDAILLKYLIDNKWKISNISINYHINVLNNCGYEKKLGYTKRKFLKRLIETSDFVHLITRILVIVIM